MKLSDRVENMQFSPIRRFNRYAFEAEAKGLKVYRLNIGQPDIQTPECFMEAIRNYDNHVIAYAESGGMSDLIEAIQQYYENYGMHYDKSDILVTSGGSEALYMLFTSLLDPGDEVIIPQPFYTNYNSFILAACGKVVPVTTRAEEGYAYADRKMIEDAITDKTKAICLSNPGNPTGTLLSREQMQLIADIALKHDLIIIADEVYREFTFDGKKVISFGNFKELDNHLVLIDSVSKRFSACGARIGCAITKNKKIQEGLMKIAQGRLSVSTIDQIGAAALYRMDSSYFDEIRDEYEKRRDAAYEEIMKIPGVICMKPGGAFYMTVKLPIDDVEDFLMFMLTEFEDQGETVMFAPGGGFYGTPGFGNDRIRIAYVLNEKDMRRGAQLIALGLKAYMEKE